MFYDSTILAKRPKTEYIKYSAFCSQEPFILNWEVIDIYLLLIIYFFIKTPVGRSISTGSSSMSVIAKDQSMDMNGPLVPEKVLKSIQVCGI